MVFLWVLVSCICVWCLGMELDLAEFFWNYRLIQDITWNDLRGQRTKERGVGV